MEKACIMVVDDEKDFADNLATIISDVGENKVIVAYSAKEAIELLKKNQSVLGKNHIRLIILDIKMPEMDGVQFLEKIRLEYTDMGVIILTAYEDLEKWEKARKGLVASYIKKPVASELLLNKIRKFFEGKEQWMIEQTKWELLEKENNDN